MNTFIGHQKNWDHLLQEADQDRLASGYLFYGQQGIGKKRVAISLAQYLFCETATESNEAPLDLFGNPTQEAKPRPCRECSACVRIQENHHPDFYLITSDGSRIKIDTIRDLQKKLAKASLEADYKFVIIDEAEKMSPQAANSLLKTLEEPPAKTHFVLLTTQLFRLLPTIRSRLRKLYFTPPAIDESISIVQNETNLTPEAAKSLLEFTEGSLGLAIELGQEGFDEWNQTLDRLLKQQHLPFSQITKLVQTWTNSDQDLSLILEVLKKKLFHQITSQNDLDSISKIDLIQRAQND